jgi:hypothetical protein
MTQVPSTYSMHALKLLDARDRSFVDADIVAHWAREL